ncbi:hypothetical protein JCM8097_007708 [Rhodosporidiobolus ruineniae]
MSQSTSGPCLVCGEETTSRCEACRQAGIDLFFCSREHQKLVWFVHKVVCGPRSNPFLWPPFLAEEVEEVSPTSTRIVAISARNSRLPSGSASPSSSLISPAKFRNFCGTLAIAIHPRGGELPFKDPLGQETLIEVRCSESIRVGDPTKFDGDPTKFDGLVPILRNATIFSAHTIAPDSDICRDVAAPPSSAWVTQLNHLVLVFTTLKHLRLEDRRRLPFYSRTARRFRDHVSSALAGKPSEMLLNLLSKLDRFARGGGY